MADPDMQTRLRDLVKEKSASARVGPMSWSNVRITPPATGWPSAKGMSGLNLTPQEKFLYQHHLDNLQGGKAVRNPDGSISTLFQLSVGIGGRTYNIPTVWDGKTVSPDEAKARAAAIGWDKWPSYPTEQAAGARYDAMHEFMGQDVELGQ